MNVLTRTPNSAPATTKRSTPSFSLAAFMPRADSPGGPVRLPRAVWVVGGLMALTIVALAATLVVRSGDSAAPAPAQAALLAPGANTLAAAGPAGVTATPPNATAAAPVAAPAATPAPQQVAAAPVCTTCGVVESYNTVQLQGRTNGVGAIAGGVGGAVIGSKIAGRGNHTVGGLVGAIGGGLLGNAIEKHERVYTAYDVHVRMDDGSVRTVRQSTAPTVGAHVTVDGKTLHPTPAVAKTTSQ